LYKTASKMIQSVLFLGYGDLAQRSAAQLAAAGWQVVGACRRPEQKPSLAGVELVAADAGNQHDLNNLLQRQFDAIVMTLTPAYASTDPYHQGYVLPCRLLQQLLGEQSAPRLLYISSTGVYAQRDGEWVTEHSPTIPTEHSGQMLLQAEQTIASSNARVSILRCSGIYGPGRSMLLRGIQAGTATITPGWSNRIHSDDVAGFIVYLLQHPEQQQPIYLVSDNRPTLQADIIAYYAHQLGVDPTTLKRTDQLGARGNKRCDNSLLRASGYVLHYPDYRHHVVTTSEG